MVSRHSGATDYTTGLKVGRDHITGEYDTFTEWDTRGVISGAGMATDHSQSPNPAWIPVIDRQ